MDIKIINEINNRLETIEKEENVNIFYACESGSRAWGFPSTDSDYDVRFLYTHHPDWYLSIDEKRDVIERPILDEIDLNGWDVKKALKLLRKSNSPLLEWLCSPIVYKDSTPISNILKNLTDEFYNPKSSIYHYLHMAKGDFKDYLQGEIVWMKKYLYVLRPVLGCRWIEQGKGQVPMEFDFLVDNTNLDEKLIVRIKELVERKKKGEELKKEPKIQEINDFLEVEIPRLELVAQNIEVKKEKTENLDDVFRKILKMSIKKPAMKKNAVKTHPCTKEKTK